MKSNNVYSKLEQAHLLNYLRRIDKDTDRVMTGTMDVSVIDRLQKDPRFAQGGLHRLHKDVGDDLTEFRSYNGELGKGSLQIVIDKETGRFYADIDKHNPYNDLARFFGHAFGEVVPNFFRRLFGRSKGRT